MPVKPTLGWQFLFYGGWEDGLVGEMAIAIAADGGWFLKKHPYSGQGELWRIANTNF